MLLTDSLSFAIVTGYTKPGFDCLGSVESIHAKLATTPGVFDLSCGDENVYFSLRCVGKLFADVEAQVAMERLLGGDIHWD